MWSGIVLLQKQITLLHKRDCNRTQDLIPIPYCGHIARNNNQLRFYPLSKASSDHIGATPKPIPFDNTGIGKAFSATSVHTMSTICAIESEPRLVRKRTRLHCLIGNSLGNMTAVRYRDEILRPVAVPLVQQRNLILQQDNARPHVARVCQDFLANNNIAPLAWPPYSPDLAPIEHMWDELDRRVRKRRNPPATLAQLRNALIDEWNNIPMRTVNALVNSIQRRIRAAMAARGGHTRYWFSVWFWFQDLGGSYQWTSITRDLLITNQWNLELLFHTCTVLLS